MADAAELVPEVTDEDIEWVLDLMQLEALDLPRREFLKACNTLDVSACPGSGKTTLVVAKLAILARKWPHRTKGICVLSHTNVARAEIQRRLGKTVVGQRLFGYPHFIDTIHAFVNRFLALPWLNSNGYPSPIVDNDLTTAYRRGVLGREYWSVQKFLNKKFSDFDRLRVCDRNLSFDLCGKRFPAGENAPTFTRAKRAIEAAANAGYFCYDEMFVWARSLLDDCPDVAAWLRCRFPLIIIDEMQDTFALPGTMLHAIFPRRSDDIVVQRVGDPNQAIFDDAEAEPDTSDPFPDPGITRHLSIPNSHRFGPTVAALASPFAATPVGNNGLCGIGPRATRCAAAACGHAIFVFPDDSTAGVLDAYGKHVLSIFDDVVLNSGAVTAVGGVHQDASDIPPGHAHFPKSVRHYWSGYTAEIARKEPHPKTLVQYFRAAQAVVRDGGDLSPGVEKVASGLCRLASRMGNTDHIKYKARTHRTITGALEDQAASLVAYRRLIRLFLIDWLPLTEESWKGVMADIRAIAHALCDGETDETTSSDFLAWSANDASLAVDDSNSPRDAGPNVYRVLDGERSVHIRLGSIHSVKGQTHVATLLLNTFWHAHSSKQMLPWLLGEKMNGGGANARDRKRLLQTYVAMTRPSHMVCLAIPRSPLGDTVVQHVATLSDRGWRVAEITEGAPAWLT